MQETDSGFLRQCELVFCDDVRMDGSTDCRMASKANTIHYTAYVTDGGADSLFDNWVESRA
jgi:hypothetical protein